ncbi:MAG: phosphoserine phosphatase SerB [Alphaproteobacteria bacterium]|nr:MAG: phosphoserine phosphatase SerB [Alphaproteobacteria bacterium]
MTHILTLIGAPGTGALNNDTAHELTALLPAAGEPVWLSPGEACDIPFAPHQTAALADLEARIRAALGSRPVDCVLLEAAGRRKKLLVADMDSTIIQQECIDEIAAYAGVKERISDITERAMRGELEFESALRERVALLAGLEEAVLEDVISRRIALTPGARTLVQTMKKHGAFCALVSGGFTFFTRRIAAMTGFDVDQANRLLTRDGRLTGTVGEPILGRDAKLQALERHRRELGLKKSETMAIGDGANDLAMIIEAGLGVAFHAKPVVAAQAHARIDHADLTALLYLQGYRAEAFIS